VKIVVQNASRGAAGWQFLIYQHGQNEAKFFGVTGSSKIEVLRRHSNWSSSWSIIVPTALGRNGGTGLLFYDRSCKRGEFYLVDTNCELHVRNSYDGWRPKWTSIISGAFGNHHEPGLLFYEKGTGDGEFYALDEKAEMALLNTYQGWHKGWSHIVPMTFALKERKHALMFYDSTTRRGEVYPLESGGVLGAPPSPFTTAESFSHVVPSISEDPRKTEALFYSASSGRVEIASLSAPGIFNGFHSSKDWPIGINDIMVFDRKRGEGLQFILHFDEKSDDRFQIYTNRGKEHRSPQETQCSKLEAYYLEALGLTGAVTMDSVIEAYKEKIKETHPDKVQHMAKKIRDLAEKETKELNAARDFFNQRFRKNQT
jgi:hypothetical protein